MIAFADTGPTGQLAAPTALVSWAHSNTDWGPDQSADWERTVKSFTDLLREGGIDADLDLFHQSDTSIDWTRWGPNKVRTSDFVIVAISRAWSERWQGINAPTVGAGAAAEADTLKGIFGKDQSEFQRKTLIALLPGATSDLVPEDLYRLNRYTLTELNRESAEDLIRAVFNAPRYVAQPVGPRPTFDGALPSPAPATPSVTALRHATTPFEATGSAEYFERLSSVSDERSRHRRRGAGLTDRQVQSTLSFRAQVPQALHFGSGELRIVHGPLGSGKSDLAEEWHRSSLRRAMADGGAAVPVWITIDGLGTAALEPFVLAEVGLSALSDRGVDVVVDGLDERADRASSLMRQAGEFVKKWPRSRVLLTTRSPGLAPDELLVAAPLLTHQEAEGLMERVAGRQIPALGAQLQTAVLRPLFALLVAQRIAAVEGATGIHEVIDRVVDDVVSRENYDLFAELRALAVETIRGGGAIDPATIAAADVAARIRSSPLVTTTGRKCAFALATFEQWFAAHAILDGIVGMDEVLSTMDTFDRWRYVLAILAATGDPARADKMLAALASWNPGAASWVVDEMESGGLSRALPNVGPSDWEAFGQRARIAMQSWLDGLGPLASCFAPLRRFAAAFDDIAVAVRIYAPRVTMTWLPRFQIRNEVLPPVVDDSVLSRWQHRSFQMSTAQMPTAANGIWQITRDLIAADITENFADTALQIALQHAGVARNEARVYQAAARLRNEAPPGFTGHLDIERLYPAADIAPSPSHPFGGYSTETMYRYAVAVIDAAMRCYLELSSWLTPRFGRALPLRGLMPVEFFGSMFYEPDRERSPYEFGVLLEPGFSWLFRPLGSTPGYVLDPDDNRISLTINDDARSDEMTADRTRLYASYRSYIEAHPEYEPFARPFSSTHGRIDVFHRTPATQLAIGWLWEDLKELGFVNGISSPNL